MSRSIRLTTTNDPNSSARSRTPKANVAGQFETSVNPSLSSKFNRYALIDHFRAGRISPLGTYHSPVSPRNVVVAGRTSAASGGGGAVGGSEVWDCANAGD